MNADINLSEREAAAVYGMIVKAKELDENIFEKEAGAMENLAADISNTIYNAKKGEWKEGEEDNNIRLLLRGFNRYIMEKVGVKLVGE